MRLASSPGPPTRYPREERAWYPLLAHARYFIGMSINRVFSVYFRVTLTSEESGWGQSSMAGSADDGEFDRALQYALLQLGTPSITPKPEQKYGEIPSVLVGKAMSRRVLILRPQLRTVPLLPNSDNELLAVVADRHKRHTQEPATFCILHVS